MRLMLVLNLVPEEAAVFSDIFKGIEYYLIGIVLILLLLGYGLGKVF